jgi:hypothetical protein
MSEINVPRTYSGDMYNGYCVNLLPTEEEYLVIFMGISFYEQALSTFDLDKKFIFLLYEVCLNGIVAALSKKCQII